jgi:hypothetical protein
MLNVAVQEIVLPAHLCSGVEFPAPVKGLFRPHYVCWSEQKRIENHAPLVVEAFRDQMKIAGGPFLFPSGLNSTGPQKTLKTVWRKTLRRAKVLCFLNYDLRSACATRLSAGGVAVEWVTQLLRKGDSQGFKRWSQMNLQMEGEALEKLNRQVNEMARETGTATIKWKHSGTVRGTVVAKNKEVE